MAWYFLNREQFQWVRTIAGWIGLNTWLLNGNEVRFTTRIRGENKMCRLLQWGAGMGHTNVQVTVAQIAGTWRKWLDSVWESIYLSNFVCVVGANPNPMVELTESQWTIKMEKRCTRKTCTPVKLSMGPWQISIMHLCFLFSFLSSLPTIFSHTLVYLVLKGADQGCEMD